MRTPVTRRDLLKTSAALAGAAAASGIVCVEVADAAPIEVPVVDGLTMRVLIDSAYDNFFRPAKARGVAVEPPPRSPDYRRALHNQWGLSLYMESQRGGEARTTLLDFGYTPEALIGNMELVGADPRKVEALVLSHGHFDHYGGLIGFLDKYRDALPAELALYCGGEDNFCRRLSRAGAPGQFAEVGVLDRRELAARRVKVVPTEQATIVAGHAFTTGPIKRTSVERVLPNTFVEFAIKDGLGCNAGHYTPAELQGKIVPDEHVHEHATCFNLKDKGLVVITSCGHAGIINSVRQAQEVSGVRKLHALIGGMHLAPAPADYLKQVIGELKTLDPDVVVPMHCSGANFVEAVRAEMPDRLLVPTTGSRIVFNA